MKLNIWSTCEFYTNITDFIQNILKILNEWSQLLHVRRRSLQAFDILKNRLKLFRKTCPSLIHFPFYLLKMLPEMRWPLDAALHVNWNHQPTPVLLRTICILPWKSLHTFQMKQEASSQQRCWISNSSRVESAAPWRCHRPARRQPVLRQTAWSRGRPRPPTGQAGKTPLWTPPRCLEATWTRHACPAVPPCHRTPEGAPSVERGGVESAGPTRAGCTVRAEIWKTSAHSDACFSELQLLW